MLNFFRRIKAISRTRLITPKSQIYFANDVLIVLEAGASIEVAGKVTIGFPLPGHLPFPSHSRSVVSLKKGAKLIFKGDAAISSGTGIYLGEDAILEFKGNNTVGHNSLILCKQRVTYGLNTCSSWNFTAIDNDGHLFHTPKGQPIVREQTPLVLGDNVAIQINVTIPKGVKVGDGAIIGAGTTLRQDIPSNVRVYGRQELRVRNDITYGFQFENEQS